MDNIQEAIQASHPTLILFTSPESPSDAEARSVTERISDDFKGRARVFVIDGRSNQEMMRTYHVATYPTYILFKDGQEVWHDGGNKPYHELHDMVSRFI